MPTKYLQMRTLVALLTLSVAVAGCGGSSQSVPQVRSSFAQLRAAIQPPAGLQYKVFTAGQTPGFLPTADARGIGGANGRVWFTDDGTPAIGTISSAGTVQEFTGVPSGSIPVSIIAGKNGDAWFTDGGTTSVGHVTSSGTIIEYTAPQLSGTRVQDLAMAPDGSIWFVATGPTSYIAHLKGTTVTAQAVSSSLGPDGSIAVDKSGNVWFLAGGPNFTVVMGKRLPGGKIVQLKTNLQMGSEPCCPNLAAKRMVIGPDGNPWFTTLNYVNGNSPANFIGTVQSGRVKMIKVNNGQIGYPVYPSGIAATPTRIWFAGNDPFQFNGGLWEMTTAGKQTSHAVQYSPETLASSGPGHVWFTSVENGQPSQIVEAISQ